MIPSIRALGFSAALALSSCGAPAAPDACNTTPHFESSSCGNPRVTEGCQTTVSVRVTDDITPRIDWSPSCGVNHVVVRAARNDGHGGLVFWAFSAEGRLVSPGLQYGVLPPGALSEGPTRILQAGTAYQVSVEMIVDGSIITGQGTTTFTR